MPKIVILDGFTTNPGDLSWEPIKKFGDLKIYNRSSAEEGLVRAESADILVTNKFKITEAVLSRFSDLKLICQLATGYDNIDIAAAKRRGISVCNAVGYSTPSVAQHVFALILKLTNEIALHNESVQNGDWSNSIDWSYQKTSLTELSGKTLGIFGFGKIGQRVAQIGLAFGMRIIAFRRNTVVPPPSGIEYVSFDKLLSESDFLSLHAPLTDSTREIFNQTAFAKMKSTGCLINTGRGGLIREEDLRQALLNETIAAAVDVLSSEPPASNNPLFGLKNCIITPHQAWATKESRARLINIVADNIDSFLKGMPKNLV